MKTLQDAWDWYESAKINLGRMQRLGLRHWNDDSLQNASIWKDDSFKEVEASDLERETARALNPIDDLGILVLFSVFETAVRDHLEGIIKPLTGQLGHPLLKDAADDVLEGIRQGSFATNVLTPLQNQMCISPNLSDKVKQVRDYRNWVAHGKREPREKHVINLTPGETFTRLKEFLDTLGIASKIEKKEIAEPHERKSGEAPK